MSTNTSTTPSPASDAFLDSLLSMVNQEDMCAILKAQTQMLDRFEKTNEMLSNFNRLSSKRYEKTVDQFREHTDTLLTMKKDLDSVFRRIRTLKKKLATDYPQAFVAALEDIAPPDLDEEEEGQSASTPSKPLLQHPEQTQQHHELPPNTRQPSLQAKQSKQLQHTKSHPQHAKVRPQLTKQQSQPTRPQSHQAKQRRQLSQELPHQPRQHLPHTKQHLPSTKQHLPPTKQHSQPNKQPQPNRQPTPNRQTQPNKQPHQMKPQQQRQEPPNTAHQQPHHAKPHPKQTQQHSLLQRRQHSQQQQQQQSQHPPASGPGKNSSTGSQGKSAVVSAPKSPKSKESDSQSSVPK